MQAKKCLIFFSLLIEFVFALSCNAQTIQETRLFAGEQFAAGNTEAAIVSYERVLFFDKERQHEDVYEKLGDCYFGITDYTKAAGYYDLAFFASATDSLKTEMILRKSIALLSDKKYLSALSELYNLDDDLPTSTLKRKDFYLGVTYFGLEQFDSAFSKFSSCADTHSLKRVQLKDLYLRNRKIDRIHPKTARILSMIFPGAGQFYAGDFKNGFNSLLLTGALAWLFANTYINTSMLEAYVVVFPWFQRYYTGGFRKAEIIAQERKIKKRTKVFGEVLTVLGREN